jgi:3-oxoacyl-[acyl-carrier-protein] synthase II
VTGDVAITGLGLVTPAGAGVAAGWAALCAGEPLAATDPDLAGLPVDFSCRVPVLDTDTQLGRQLDRRLDPFSRWALVAAREAVADAGLAVRPEAGIRLDPAAAVRVAVILGVGANSLSHYEDAFACLFAGTPEAMSPIVLTRSVPNMVAGEVAMDLGAHGPCFTTSSACASAATAIGVARGLINAGLCDIAITGGSESARIRATAACFARMGALSRRVDDPAGASRPFAADRDGFVLGEGTGILVLERPEHAAARGARVRAFLSGYGASADAYHPARPHPEGYGAQLAIRAALADAGLAPADIDHVNAHGTGTVLSDRAEANALRAVFGCAPPVTATKSIFGHPLGAGGGIEAVATVLALEEQLIPPTANLDEPDPDLDLDLVAKGPRLATMRAAVSNSFGFGGQNAVLVLRTD